MDAQDLMTGGDGTKTIDGKTWYLIYSVNASSVGANNGQSGLYIRNNATVTGNYATNTENGPRLRLPISNLGGVEPYEAVETWLWVMFSTPHSPNANYELASFGLSTGQESLATPTTFQHMHFERSYSSGLSGQISLNLLGTETNITALSSTSDVVVLRLVGHDTWQIYLASSVAGEFPDRSALVLSGYAKLSTQNFLYSTLGGMPGATQTWFYFNVCSGNTAGASDGLLKKLKLEQR